MATVNKEQLVRIGRPARRGKSPKYDQKKRAVLNDSFGDKWGDKSVTNNRTNLDELTNIARKTPQYNRERNFSKLDTLNQIAQTRRQQMNPQIQEQKRQTSQQYENLGRRIKEEAANLGMLRSGRTMNKLLPEVGRDRIRALNQIEQNAMQQAYSQALPVAEFGLDEQRYLDALKNQQAQRQFTNLLDLYNIGQTQSNWQQQFDLERALQEAGLTGRYGGEDTLQRIALEDELERLKRDQRLRALQALMDYNLGVGSITDDLPMPNKFYYGDTMVDLLNNLY